MGNCCGGEEDQHAMNIKEKDKKKGAAGVGNYGGYDESGEDKDILEFCNSKV